MVVLGGMGNIWGVAVGAFVIYMIQTVILKRLNGVLETVGVPAFDLGPIHRPRGSDFVQYQFLLYGIALVVMMLLRPEGLFPNQRRRRSSTSRMTSSGDDGEETGSLGPTPGADEELGVKA